ncbi:MAG: dUTP diphosphatase [Micrococcaceae bacterium]|nr:dUTP diphosphatase [Micrococcaceae bacterium]
MEMRIKRLTDTAILPTRAKAGDAGMDFYADESFTLHPMERRLASTGIAVQLPVGTVGLVHPRSGLAHRDGATVLNAPGTVDQGYRGEVKINVINLGQDALIIEAGDRIGQMLVQKFETPALVEVDTLDASERGDGGHGSTGR